MEDSLTTLRRTTAHIASWAVLRLYPGAGTAACEVTDRGFACRFTLPGSLGTEALNALTLEIKKIARERYRIERRETLCQMGDYSALCDGPLCDHTGRLKLFALVELAAEEGQLCLCGTACHTQQELDADVKQWRRERSFRQKLPMQLAPVQVMILPVTEKQNGYAEMVLARLLAAGLRTEANLSCHSMGEKIRDARERQVPFLLLASEKEALEELLSVRLCTGEAWGSMNVEEFIEKIANLEPVQ